ncbi:MAG: zinc-ribbon domain-containing protein [Nitrososphaeria archaeon]|jgi:TM2 domain-containing membrane protein YozV
MSGTTSEGSTQFCQYCGAEIDIKAEICPKCGLRVVPPPIIPPSVSPSTVSTPQKSVALAAALSFIFVGLGQIYNGQIRKGIEFIIAGIVCIILIFVLIGTPLYFVLWVYSIYDAYNTAKKINAGTIKT